MSTKIFACALTFTLAAAVYAQPPGPAAPQLPVPGQAKPDFDIPKPDGSKGGSSQPRAAGPINPDGYIIGPQDNLSITVTDETDLTGKYRVDTDGSITMPYLSRVPVAGMTLADAQLKIASLLKSGQFLRNPQVRVEVDQFKSRKVTVTGEVRTPGPITMTGTTMTLLEALALAGSPTTNASNDVIVQHKAKVAGEADPAPVIVNKKDLEL